MIKLTFIGHACFKLERDDYAVIFDPYEDGYVPGLKNIREEANLVLCSHEHNDHNARSLVNIREEQVNPFTITEIHTYHDEVQGAKRGLNTIHILDDGDMRIAHIGDLGCELQPEEIKTLKDLDLVMIPVGGFFTIDADQAKNLLEQIQPKVTVPMHYRGKTYGFDMISTIDPFLEGLAGVTISETSSLILNGITEQQIIILQPEAQ